MFFFIAATASFLSGKTLATTINKPEIRLDEKTQTVRIIIEGKEIFLINADGVDVKGDIRYSGAIADTNDAR